MLIEDCAQVGARLGINTVVPLVTSVATVFTLKKPNHAWRRWYVNCQESRMEIENSRVEAERTCSILRSVPLLATSYGQRGFRHRWDVALQVNDE